MNCFNSFCTLRIIPSAIVAAITVTIMMMPAVGVQAHNHSNEDASGHNSIAVIQISNARVNPIFTGMSVTAAYFTLYNTGDKTIRLMSVEGAISKRIEIHEHTMNNGLMKMQEVAGGVELHAGETTHFSPGGYHVMIMNLKQDIKEGDVVELTLKFADSHTQVIKATAKKPSMDHSSATNYHNKHHDKQHKH